MSFKLFSFLLISFCLFYSSRLCAQWDYTLSAGVEFGYTITTPADIQSIVIGRFDANPILGFSNLGSRPQARFHISDFFMTPIPAQFPDTVDYFPLGALIRTVGNRSIENNWRLFTGDDHPSATEKGRLFVSGWDFSAPQNVNQSGKEFNVQSSEGHLLLNSYGFSTNPLQEGIRNRIRIGSFDWAASTSTFDNLTGVAITAGSLFNSTTIPSLFPIINPQAILHLGTPPPTGSADSIPAACPPSSQDR
jgi:hypothetical protein